MPPKISVNIITHNRARLLGRAINSVQAQSETDWELIIIDDGSEDDTAEVVKSFKDARIKYTPVAKHDSIGALRNIGLKLSRGKYVAVLDDDDYWTDPDKLKKQANFLDRSGYNLVGTAFNLIDKDGRMIGKKNHLIDNEDIRKKMTAQNMFAHSTAMFPRAIAIEVNGYDQINLAEDYSLWLKLGTRGRIANLADQTTNYTANNSNYRDNDQKMIKMVYQVVKNYLRHYPNRYQNSSKWLYRRIKSKII
ncbi:MAG: glycosyltransferase [Patescibacteria group bacterium]